MILVGRCNNSSLGFHSEDLKYIDVSVNCKKFDLLSRIKFYFSSNGFEVCYRGSERECIAFTEAVQKKGCRDEESIKRLVDELAMNLLSLHSNPFVAQKDNFRMRFDNFCMRFDDYILACIEEL